MTLEKFDRYVIIEELGRGGMAEVYKAHDPRFDRLVALKIIRKQFSKNPRFNRRFQEEASTIANLEHRAILPVYDFGEEEGQLFLVMRLMPDVLDRRLEKDGPIPLEETSLILTRLALALMTAHNRKIVHRDIKPANILLDDKGTAFLADFGLAAPITKIEPNSMPSSYGGSPFYMAPEQWQDGKVGSHTDVYQLGVTLFEMLTGERPYPEADMQILLDRHVNAGIPAAREINPDLPPAIEAILEKAMAKNPEDRYDTPQELAEAVAKLLHPELIKNRYEIKKELRHERMATVYLAHDVYENQEVALKIINHKLIRNQQYQQRFQQQKKIIMGIQHTAVVPVCDIGQHNEQPYLVMQLMKGSLLRDRLHEEGVFSVEMVCKFAERLASGLQVIHDANEAHGDINPGNVLLDAADNCYLTDFHMTSLVALTVAVMNHRHHLGYWSYLAPEQWRDEPLTPFTDVYQFGMLLFEMLTGKRPFPEESAEILRRCIENDLPPKATSINSDLPLQFNKVLAKAMAKKPQDRFSSVDELVNRLNQAREDYNFDTLRKQGDHFYEERQWDEAITAYNQALKIRPQDKLVQSSLERAKRRKFDSGIFYQSRLAIEARRWSDADYFLKQASPSPEKKDMQEHVQRKILVERQYDEGKAAMQRQEWVVARNLFDETDRLEPNYKDVNRQLGQLDEKIVDVLTQARKAHEQERWDEALALLDSVNGHETAVLLRQEIATNRRQTWFGAWWRGLSRNEKITLISTMVAIVGSVITLLAIFPGLLSGSPATPPATMPATSPAIVESATSTPAATPTLSIIALENCLAETAVEITYSLISERKFVSEDTSSIPMTLPNQPGMFIVELLSDGCEIPQDQLRYALVNASSPDPVFQTKAELSYLPPAEVDMDTVLLKISLEGGNYNRSVALNITLSE
jgi:serine/threonine protein kinase